MGNLFSSTGGDDSLISSSSSESISLQSDILSTAKLLRSEACQLQIEARAASEQSQFEYHSGSKLQAKILSTKKDELYKQANEKNHQAAELIFKHFNQNHLDDVIDLHGLYVAEALKYLQQKLDQCHSKNILRLTVITGMGNNSPSKIAKIKPEVENFARKNHLKITPYGGHVVIDLKINDQYETTSNRDIDKCIIQ